MHYLPGLVQIRSMDNWQHRTCEAPGKDMFGGKRPSLLCWHLITLKGDISTWRLQVKCGKVNHELTGLIMLPVTQGLWRYAPCENKSRDRASPSVLHYYYSCWEVVTDTARSPSTETSDERGWVTLADLQAVQSYLHQCSCVLHTFTGNTAKLCTSLFGSHVQLKSHERGKNCKYLWGP